MAIRKIKLYGSSILSRPVTPVGELPPDFRQTLTDMYDTMYDDDGIGLSANQVGLDMRFFVADFSLHDKSLTPQVFINPEILESSGEIIAEEGCLSLPEIRAQVPRAQRIRVRYENLDRTVLEEDYQDFAARVIQHETDHLNGIYFVDRITPLARSFLASKLKRLAARARAEEKGS